MKAFGFGIAVTAVIVIGLGAAGSVYSLIKKIKEKPEDYDELFEEDEEQ